MKKKLLLVLLIVSLGVNLGVLATAAHHWMVRKEFKQWPKADSRYEKKMRKMLQLTDEQAQALRLDREQLRAEVDPLREELHKKRAELFAMVKEERADLAKMDALINGIASLQATMEKTVLRHSLEQKKSLTPEQREKFDALLGKKFNRMPRRGLRTY